MNRNRVTVIILISVASISLGAAQSPRRRTTPARPANTKPAPADNSNTKATASTAQPASAQPAEVTPATLAIVNDTMISTSDIESQVGAVILRDPDPYLRAYYTDPDKEKKESRQRALDARVNSMLIAAEAKKHGKSADEII